MKTILILIVSVMGAFGQAYKSDPSALYKLEYRDNQNITNHIWANPDYPTNILLLNYSNTIQVGDKFYRVVTETNIVISELNHYEICICTIPPSIESITNWSEPETNITTELKEVK